MLVGRAARIDDEGEMLEGMRCRELQERPEMKLGQYRRAVLMFTEVWHGPSGGAA
jgi:hypothetical protein